LRQSWQPLDRVLDAFRLNHERRGRAAYVSWLEARAATEGGRIEEKAMEAIRGGWYLGEEGFKDKLLGLIDLLQLGAFRFQHHGAELAGLSPTGHVELAGQIGRTLLKQMGAQSGLSRTQHGGSGAIQ